ncbi:hypothetical protein OFB80_30610, partial [Escherichia coli]|nr:hypothetical protein [Escherichia coli]
IYQRLDGRLLLPVDDSSVKSTIPFRLASQVNAVIGQLFLPAAEAVTKLKIIDLHREIRRI